MSKTNRMYGGGRGTPRSKRFVRRIALKSIEQKFKRQLDKNNSEKIGLSNMSKTTDVHGVYLPLAPSVNLLRLGDSFPNRTYYGANLDEIQLSWMYIQKKYQSLACVATVMNNDVFSSIKTDNSKYTLTWKMKMHQTGNVGNIIGPTDYIRKYVRKCIQIPSNNHKYIIIPLYIWCELSDNDNYAHYNVLIYNIAKSRLSRFEPWGCYDGGDACINSKCIDISIRDYFSSVITNQFDYEKPTDFSPKGKSYQSAECQVHERSTDPGGFCTVWCVMFTDVFLGNYTKGLKFLTHVIWKKLQQCSLAGDYTDIIRNYSIAINKSLKIITNGRERSDYDVFDRNNDVTEAIIYLMNTIK